MTYGLPARRMSMPGAAGKTGNVASSSMMTEGRLHQGCCSSPSSFAQDETSCPEAIAGSRSSMV